MTSSVIGSWWSSYRVGVGTNRARMGSRARFFVSWRMLAIFLAMKFITIPLTIALFGALAGPARADSPRAEDEQVETVVVSGEIVTVSRYALSVEFAHTEQSAYELLLPFAKDVQLEGAKSFKDLTPGDQVQVAYEQTYRTGADGQRVVLKTQATKIALLRTALPEGSLRATDGGR